MELNQTLIFGHKNPDTDAVMSSIVMANLENQLGNQAKAVRLGNINKETEYVLNYLGIEAPELIEGVEDGANVILVDHNSPKESIENLENVNIFLTCAVPITFSSYSGSSIPFIASSISSTNL